jgi:MFS family permease
MKVRCVLFVEHQEPEPPPPRAPDDAPAARSEEEARRWQQSACRLLYAHMFLNVTVLCLPIQARPVIIKALTKGDAGRTAAILAGLTSAVGLAEFLVNPVVGRLSDCLGRRPFLLLSPVASAGLKLLFFRLIAAAGKRGGRGSGALTARLLALERVICGALATVSGSTLCSAVLSDLYSDEGERAAASAVLGSWAGIGVILGPWLGGRVLGSGATPAACFGLAGVLAVAQLALLRRLPETLPAARRRPMDWSAVSPFTFLRLFRGPPTLRKLAVAAGLQCVPEGKNVSELNQVYMTEDVGTTSESRTRALSQLRAHRLPVGSTLQLARSAQASRCKRARASR